jgi:O-6-methylguanine DNA methyltransferase
MTVNGNDPLISALGRLGATPVPHGLVDRVYAGWVRLEGAASDLYVAFTDRGVAFIRTVGSVRDEDEFAEAFRREFGMPLRPASRPPAGLAAALQLRSTGRDVPVDLRNVSDFERDVLVAARRIPKGQTRPYSWIAHEIGRPRAVRAVGTALGNNPVPLLIPCHRVVRADGSLGEYVFGGALKERLLRAEQVNVDEVRELAKTKVFFIGSDTTHIVCFPTCTHARRITPEHRRGFPSVAAAASAGYRPCRRCRPVLAATA